VGPPELALVASSLKDQVPDSAGDPARALLWGRYFRGSLLRGSLVRTRESCVARLSPHGSGTPRFLLLSLPLPAPLELLLRVFLRDGEVQSPLDDLREVPLRVLDPDDLRRPQELLLESLVSRKAKVMDLGLRGLNGA